MQWIKKQLKRFWRWFAGLFVVSVALASGFSNPIIVKIQKGRIDTEIISIKESILSDRQVSGKFKRQARRIVKGIEYEVHEYENSKGETGFVIYITKQKNGETYRKVLSSGVEKVRREHDWRIVKNIL